MCETVKHRACDVSACQLSKDELYRSVGQVSFKGTGSETHMLNLYQQQVRGETTSQFINLIVCIFNQIGLTRGKSKSAKVNRIHPHAAQSSCVHPHY